MKRGTRRRARDPLAHATGELAERMRALDWATTPLGAPAGWPERLRTLVEIMLASLQPMFVAWGPRRIMLYNDGYAPMLADRHPHALGRPFDEVWFDILDTVGPIMDRAYAGEPTFMEDIAFTMHRRGYPEETHFAFSYTPVRDDVGAVVGMFCTCVETTGEVAAAHALRESETRFRAMADQAPVAIWTTDAEGSSTYLNAAWYRMSGQVEGSALGHGWLDAVHPDDRAEAARIFERARARRAPFRLEYRLVLPDGTHRWALDSAAPRVDETGAYLGHVGTVVDLTDRKAAERLQLELTEHLEELVDERTAALAASEQRFRGIFDASLQFVALLETDGTVLEVNRTAMEWSAIRPDEIVGLPFWTVAPMRGSPALQAAIEGAIRRAAAGEVVREEHEMRGAGDVRATIDFSLKPVLGREGEPLYLVAEGRDLTALKQAQDHLRHEQKINALGQLTGGVAHDFNNLLMVLSTGLHLLDRVMDPERRTRVRDNMRAAVERGTTLTRQLLAFSRRRALEPERVDLAAHVDAMREMLERTLGGDVRVETRFPPDLWPVHVDPGELELAVLNLCVNARDAMSGGVILVSAENAPDVREAELRGDFVRLSVRDEGSGMTPEVIARVFEPFYTTKDVGRGSGLGLPQVLGFATQSGGTARIASEPGAGTTVTLWLPRAPEGAAAPAPEAPPREPRGPGGALLLVEDDDAVADSTVALLEQFGWTVTRASAAAEALRLLDEGLRVDVVLSDVMMPGGTDGLALARLIRQRHPDLPVLLTSGHPEAARPEARSADIELLPKPYGPDALAAALRRVRRL